MRTVIEYKKEKGFTLVELLVVIAVIGALSAIVASLINPAGFFARGRDGRRMSDLSTIQSALEAYYAENNSYPSSLPSPGSPWTSGGITYLKSMPGDPKTGNPYSYAVSGSNYEICADMEQTPPDSCDYTTPKYGASGNCCLTNPF